MSTVAQDEVVTGYSSVKASYESSFPEYGPVYVPTRLQKGNKRQTVDYFYPPFQLNHELIVVGVLLRDVYRRDRVRSAHFVLNLADRAPPRFC